MGTAVPLHPWIRSAQYGRRVMEAKDKKYYSNPSDHSKDFGHYNPPVPDTLLQQLADMKIQQSSHMNSQQQQFQQQYMSQTMSKVYSSPRNTHSLNLEKKLMEIAPQTQGINSAKRQRTANTTSPQHDMARPAKQASQKL